MRGRRCNARYPKRKQNRIRSFLYVIRTGAARIRVRVKYVEFVVRHSRRSGRPMRLTATNPKVGG